MDSAPGRPAAAVERCKTGLFPIRSKVLLSEVAALYDLPTPDDLKALTVAAAFEKRFENGWRRGDLIQLGPAALVADETARDQHLRATLVIEDEDDKGRTEVG